MVENGNEDQRQEATETVASLLSNCASLHLSTLNDDGSPESSYAPFVYHERAFHILVSELAAHTRNLSQHPLASCLIIEPEDQARNPFARRRMTIHCNAERLDSDSPQLGMLLDRFQERHGDTVAVLRELPDFHIIRLTVVSGRVIRGFGQAWDLDPDLEVIRHVRPDRGN